MNKLKLAIGSAIALVGIKLLSDNMPELHKLKGEVDDRWKSALYKLNRKKEDARLKKKLEKDRQEREKWLDDNEIYFV